jgi:hypothetical protein
MGLAVFIKNEGVETGVIFRLYKPERVFFNHLP